MSIVTNFQAVPSRLFCIYAAVAESENGLLQEQLEAWSTPPALAKRGANDDEEGTTELLKNSLSELVRRLGLIEDDGERLRIPKAAGTDVRRTSDLQTEFMTKVREVLFDPKRAVAAGQEGVLYALAWFLTKSPLHPVIFSDDPKNKLREDLGEFAVKVDLGSTASFQNLLYWARYLGFATVVGDSKNRRAFPDPTRAISAVLNQVLMGNDWLDIDVFLSRLADLYPVLEGGSIREELETMSKVQSASDDRLSIATSFALQRLDDRGSISLDAVADAKTIRILDFGGNTKRVSRVRLGVAK